MDTKTMGNSSNAFADLPLGQNPVRNVPPAISRLNHLLSELTAEVRRDLLSYLEEKGLINDQSILVIPSTKHYFYDVDDLKGIKTIVNLKPLNYVREIRDFLHKIAELIPGDSTFVGCFTDNKSQNGFYDKYSNLPRNLSEKAEAYENGIESRIPFINRMYSFIDMKTNRYLTRRTVTNLLLESNLHIVSMTEINGLTYFHTRKRAAHVSLIA